MQIAYAFRRSIFYPYAGGSRALPDGETRSRYLGKVKEIGFDGIELGFDSLGGIDATRAGVLELRKELDDHGTPCVAVRGGGGFHHPRTVSENRESLGKAIDVAAWLGAGIVNTSTGAPPRNPGAAGSFMGEPTSQGSSRLATADDFARTSKALHEYGEIAGAHGINITLEVHQHSITDNSWSTLHMLDLIDSPHVFVNPDLGNVYWVYDEPEETSDEAIVALAPRSKYWHCKNLHRVHIPENEHSIFIRVPLPDGDLDYRFAISAMQDAGYDGYLAIEGATSGDALHQDRRSFEYVKSVLRDINEDGAG